MGAASHCQGDAFGLGRVFCGKKEKGSLESKPLCIFWTVWKARDKIVFEKEVLSIQRLRSSFYFYFYFLWSEMKLFIKDSPSILVDFIDWVGTH